MSAGNGAIGNGSGNGHPGNGHRPGNGSGPAGRSTRTTGYSTFSLLRHGLTKSAWPRAWREHDLQRSYDVVIVGGGIHGLATA